MKRLKNQYGVTLLEVLVGFVIFSASLVAILNFVSGQIYHAHISAENLQKVQLIYDYSNAFNGDVDFQSGSDSAFDLSVSSSVIEESKQRQGEFALSQYEYSVSNTHNSLVWTSIKID